MYISRRKLLLIGVLVAAALTFNIGFAQGNVRIFACVDEDGNLRIVQEAETCGEKERPLDWSREGPRGEPGPQGDQGPPGLLPDVSCPDGQFVTGILDGALECKSLPGIAAGHLDSDAARNDFNANIDLCEVDMICDG